MWPGRFVGSIVFGNTELGESVAATDKSCLLRRTGRASRAGHGVASLGCGAPVGECCGRGAKYSGVGDEGFWLLASTEYTDKVEVKVASVDRRGNPIEEYQGPASVGEPLEWPEASAELPVVTQLDSGDTGEAPGRSEEGEE